MEKRFLSSINPLGQRMLFSIIFLVYGMRDQRQRERPWDVYISSLLGVEGRLSQIKTKTRVPRARKIELCNADATCLCAGSRDERVFFPVRMPTFTVFQFLFFHEV